MCERICEWCEPTRASRNRAQWGAARDRTRYLCAPHRRKLRLELFGSFLFFAGCCIALVLA